MKRRVTTPILPITLPAYCEHESPYTLAFQSYQDNTTTITYQDGCQKTWNLGLTGWTLQGSTSPSAQDNVFVKGGEELDPDSHLINFEYIRNRATNNYELPSGFFGYTYPSVEEASADVLRLLDEIERLQKIIASSKTRDTHQK